MKKTNSSKKNKGPVNKKKIEVVDFKKNESKKKEKMNSILTIVQCLVILLILIITSFKSGFIGIILDNILVLVFGSFYLLLGIEVIFWKLYICYSEQERKGFVKAGLIIIGVFFLLLANVLDNNIENFTELFDYLIDSIKYITVPKTTAIEGGLLGNLLGIIILKLIGNVGKIASMAVLALAGILLLIPFDKIDSSILFEEVSYEPSKPKENYFIDDVKKRSEPLDDMRKTGKGIIKKESNLKTKKDIFINDVVDKKNSKTNKPTKENKEEKPRKSGDYVFPSLSLLEEAGAETSSANEKAAVVKGNKIIEILRTFDIDATLLNTCIGPSVTKFEVRPKQDVKISKIQNISDNIKMELAAKEIRIEAPIPGKSAVGIEIPNVESVPVKMRDLIDNMPSKLSRLPLIFGLGKNLSGECIYCDLEKLPHILVAGATGSGKSVCINTIITSYLMKSDPKELKLVLIDPKKVEFTPYHDIPHLLWPVITDTKMATMMLQKIVVIMEHRYELMAEVGVRNIQGYNEYIKDYNSHLEKEEKPKELLPRIVIIIDELADLMLMAGKEVEMAIQRITQLARASGIHLIVATQRPSTDVITGLIKSNIPSRISFAVSSAIDSRTILDQSGAEKLLGNGDMLYFPSGESAPVRVQGCFVSDKEINAVAKWTKEQAKPEYDDTYFEIQNNLNGTIIGQGFAAEHDALYDEVVEYVKETQKASTSLLQRKFGIGYNRAARLIDTLEDRGIVGPVNGSKPREVYAKPD